MLHRRGDQTAWAVDCLRRSRRLWTELGDPEGQLTAAETLALALSDLPGGFAEAQLLIAETLEPARQAAYALARRGEAGAAVDLVERTRVRAFGGDVLAGRVDFPVAYVLPASTGTAVLLARGGQVDVAIFHQPDERTVAPPDERPGGAPTDAVRRVAGPLGRLLQPVVDALHRDGEERLTVVATGAATWYPWAAAEVTDPATGERVPVGDLLTLSLASSAAMAGESRRRASEAEPGGAVIFADPERSRAEAAEVEGSFGGTAAVLMAGEATRAALLRELPGCRYAHLACPGFDDRTEAEPTRLVLTGGEVTPADVRALPPLQARLVFLSACPTGPDDTIGWPGTLLAAGVAAVVSTLWPVDGRVTALMAGRFYRELALLRRRGAAEDVALALRRSQHWLRTEKGLADPYFWAGFVVYGS
ncbi:hypothetical protein Aab01nite_44020 [Paractinoplanes abujensis]|uniref:CHAT domain-containing protein n=1 Tax=Paractinoplanes abujensis TaxID=882441 RepID=A0A7W7FYV8_9ACTN|nr:CHAT domain-containing protein [Actinoplanes abujensis]MBB4690039.1 hypothetical protein [Actinoplanes abujensis]GID20812.1 hypothetical protein Aab01nite_44020 [Actinoplanes abujensis]